MLECAGYPYLWLCYTYTTTIFPFRVLYQINWSKESRDDFLINVMFHILLLMYWCITLCDTHQVWGQDLLQNWEGHLNSACWCCSSVVSGIYLGLHQPDFLKYSVNRKPEYHSYNFCFFIVFTLCLGAFYVLCKAHWIALWLKCAIQLNLSCLAQKTKLYWRYSHFKRQIPPSKFKM